ncbi:MAG TPA: LysR family transcriptional regulator [Kiloniellales bacterium]|nr:LysR family transcriptional regulator [Kiloniellales bacterium]
MRFDLIDLRLFLAVVEAGSITRGAADAGLSLSAASERLRDMEALGEIRLLTRSRRGVVPTEAGEALAHHARSILQQMAQMRGELGHYAKGLRASIRLLANTAAITEFLPERLSPWLDANPRADVDLKERQSLEIARSIASGFAEIGILSNAVKTDDLTLRPFALDRLVVVVARQHPFSSRSQIRFGELLAQRFIGLSGGALQDHIDGQAARLGTRLKTRVTLRTFEGLCLMAGTGVGIAIVPETAARRCSHSAGIVILRLQEEWATRHLSLCVRNAEELTAPARSLLDHLSAAP